MNAIQACEKCKQFFKSFLTISLKDSFKIQFSFLLFKISLFSLLLDLHILLLSNNFLVNYVGLKVIITNYNKITIYKLFLIFLDWPENWNCVSNGPLNTPVRAGSVSLIGDAHNARIWGTGFSSLRTISAF